VFKASRCSAIWVWVFELKNGGLKGQISLKGQFSAEFFIVLILFVGFAAYFSMRLIAIRPIYIREVRKTIIRSESYRISEMLINDPGSPVDWASLVGTPSENQIERIGLLDHSKNKTNLLSEQKMSGLDSLCNGGAGYDTVKSMIGAEHDLSIMLIEKPSEVIKINECKPTELGENAVSIKRLAAFDSGNYGELIVQVW